MSTETTRQAQLPEKDPSPEKLLDEIRRHIMCHLGRDHLPPQIDAYYYGLSLCIRERLIRRWLATQRAYYREKARRVYYLSMEFLPGRFLINNIIKLGLLETCRETLEMVGLSITDIEEQEWDPGLGNGGLGRLASCFMDSMATMDIPGYGYGIRYDYGLFFQTLVDGYQVERCDNWVRTGNPWEIRRSGYVYEVRYYGQTETFTDDNGATRFRWVGTSNVMASACDFLIPGYRNLTVSNMRLWTAVSSREFDLTEFNEGDYIGAVENKVMSETLSKVLYPRDETIAGKELRLKQQYFFVSATLQDILRRFKKRGEPLAKLPAAVSIQLNDTHPSIAIPELMRMLIDEEELGWKEAWTICTAVFSYTNHTVMPEALESWPCDLFGRVLPRHMQIVHEIDRRFLAEIEKRYPGDSPRRSGMAIVSEEAAPRVRMANLAIVGSHTVNGVSELHGKILKTGLFRYFSEIYPSKMTHITNGITPRRWLFQINPALTRLLDSAIGTEYRRDLGKLRNLAGLVEDREFSAKWRHAKMENKNRLTAYVFRKTGIAIDPDSLFDTQAKRIHEYKRQLLNLLHVITRYLRLSQDPKGKIPPRTVIFAGKAAPGYFQAKLIIKLINSLADVINSDENIGNRLKVVFLPNYCVSQAEKIVPATELSQQISTAGMEASGTGNMKFALNGALTIGTLDGANIEIMNEVGPENMFIFGLDTEGVSSLRQSGYNPRAVYDSNPELKHVLDTIAGGAFSPGQPDLFQPILRSLLDEGDPYMVLADYSAYIQAQDAVDALYQSEEEWTRRSILNTANMGKFSSDRAIREYVQKIWRASPVSV